MATTPTASNARTRAEKTIRIGVRGQPLRDLYHRLISTTWRRLFLFFLAFYLTTNGLFAVAYYIDQNGIENAQGPLDAFFFSVQTMATIGYGKMTPRSVFANALVTFEALFGLVSTAMATGLMFAKFSRPTARVIFSRNAVISMRDGKPSLMVRIANERTVGLVEASIRMVLARFERTVEGERMLRFHPLTLVRNQTALFALSWVVIHPLDESSPLYGASAESLLESEAELIVSLVGMETSTGSTVHARHVYTASDVLMDKKFVDVFLPGDNGVHILDYRRFHDVEEATRRLE